MLVVVERPGCLFRFRRVEDVRGRDVPSCEMKGLRICGGGGVSHRCCEFFHRYIFSGFTSVVVKHVELHKSLFEAFSNRQRP